MNTTIEHKEKIWGTSLYIGSSLLETRFGDFRAYTYQDLIHKGYIIALVKGDIHAASMLYTRIHSSCVTSETLRSMDCDCVHQLEGALEKIANFGTGIFFYLIQEGRGCGYIGKSRACMHVQAQDDKITTFDAYSLLGMQADYRNYNNIFEVAKLLGVEDKAYTLITNNPDKIKGLQKIGIQVQAVESIEIAPSPFNQAYLLSKQKTGHLLHYNKTKLDKYKRLQPKVDTFEPYHLSDCSRFIHCASYYIPIKPVENKMLFSKVQIEGFVQQGIQTKSIQWIDKDSALVEINKDSLAKIDIRPYWFKVHMYYDVASNSDYVVLSYGDKQEKTPFVRIHSESLFNRFPLTNKPYSEKYKRSIEKIVLNKSGFLVLLYHDGRGAGLGSYVLNQGKGFSSSGVKIDSRDYSAVAMLLEQHVKNKKIKLLYSQSSRVLLSQALLRQNIEVCEWIDLSQADSKKGHHLIEKRINDSIYYLLNLETKKISFDKYKKYIVTGIGSSEAHARYLLYLLKAYHKDISAEFVPSSGCLKPKSPQTTLIVVSQGLSPNIMPVLENYNYQDMIVFTSVSSKNKNLQKRAILEKLQDGECLLINYPLEDEYTTLIRTVGPLVGYGAIYDSVSRKSYHSTSLDLFSLLTKAKDDLPNLNFMESLGKCSRICFLLSYPLGEFFQNITYKFTEGAFVSSVQTSDYLSFAHGVFQNIEHQKKQDRDTCFIFIINSDFDRSMASHVDALLEDRYPLWKLSTSLPPELSILYFEMVFNYFILDYIKNKNIDQTSWQGMSRQEMVYSLSSKKEILGRADTL
jgi:3,4-dihydroxy 2-butanone 4-phosphate synthase / GTP cyclohydrolase II